MVHSKVSPATWAPGIFVPGTVYRVVRLLGQGGMGEVYEVEHDLLGTRRALKVLARNLAGRKDLAERLRVEARALARLKHANLVEVYDLGFAADERIFFVMELLGGSTLRELLRHRGRLNVRQAVRLVGQVLDGLHAAHVAHMIHRDIKPENVFVCSDGLVKLLDFGVAKIVDACLPAQQITGAGMTVGTPRYMSPEQAEGRPVDARTDVYAAGLVLWEALTGRQAFDDGDPVVLAFSKLTRGVPRFRVVEGSGVPQELNAAMIKACDVDPENRYAGADEFALVIRRAAGEPEQPWASAMTPRPEPLVLDTTEIQPPVEFETTLPERPADEAFTQIRTSGLSGDTGDHWLVEPRDWEPTEHLDDAGDVDPEALTPSANSLGSFVLGPKGTHVLPAVASQHAPPQQLVGAADQLTNPSMSSHQEDSRQAIREGSSTGSLRATCAESPRSINPAKTASSRQWLGVVAAFVMPILLAGSASWLYLKNHAPPRSMNPASSAAESVATTHLLRTADDTAVLMPASSHSATANQQSAPESSNRVGASRAPDTGTARSQASGQVAVPKTNKTATTGAPGKPSLPASGL